VAFLLFFK